MRDIEAATGEYLGSDRVAKKGKGKKKKYSNLSDLKQNANTSRSRLEKKVFNKYVTSYSFTQPDHLQDVQTFSLRSLDSFNISVKHLLSDPADSHLTIIFKLSAPILHNPGLSAKLNICLANFSSSFLTLTAYYLVNL